jgi:hypothetical protein
MNTTQVNLQEEYAKTEIAKILNVLNQELQNVKKDYATKLQVPEIIFQKIGQCSVIQVTKEKWNFNYLLEEFISDSLKNNILSHVSSCYKKGSRFHCCCGYAK